MEMETSWSIPYRTTKWTNQLVLIERKTFHRVATGQPKLKRTALVVHEDKDRVKDKATRKTETKKKKVDLLIELQGRDKVKRPTLVVCDQHLLSQRGHLDKNQHRVDQKPKREESRFWSAAIYVLWMYVWVPIFCTFLFNDHCLEKYYFFCRRAVKDIHNLRIKR